MTEIDKNEIIKIRKEWLKKYPYAIEGGSFRKEVSFYRYLMRQLTIIANRKEGKQND